MQQHEKFEEEAERNIIQLTAGYPVWALTEGMLNCRIILQYLLAAQHLTSSMDTH